MERKMSVMEIQTQYMRVQSLTGQVDGLKSQIKNFTENWVYGLVLVSIAYVLTCGTFFQQTNPYILLITYMGLITFIRTVFCLYEVYDKRANDSILTMNRLYSEGKYEELRNSMNDNIEIIQKYVFLCMLLNGLYHASIAIIAITGLMAIL